MPKGYQEPAMIYHYTSIHTLALILESRKIRFNRLDRVDDVRESQTVAGVQFGKYFFVSCWTESPKEHIPLWHMYTPEMKGVRLGMPDIPFQMAPLQAPSPWNAASVGEVISPLPFEEMFKDTYCILPICISPDMFAGQVSYVPDMAEVYKKNVTLTTSAGGKATLEIGNMPVLPRTKDDYWAFQNEYRFALFITPSIPVPSAGIGSPEFVENFPNHILSSLVNGRDPGLDYYDLQLDAKALNSIEVTLGPLTDHSDRLLVEALLSKYTSDGTVKASTLASTIRRPMR